MRVDLCNCGGDKLSEGSELERVWSKVCGAVISTIGSWWSPEKDPGAGAGGE